MIRLIDRFWSFCYDHPVLGGIIIAVALYVIFGFMGHMDQDPNFPFPIRQP